MVLKYRHNTVKWIILAKSFKLDTAAYTDAVDFFNCRVLISFPLTEIFILFLLILAAGFHSLMDYLKKISFNLTFGKNEYVTFRLTDSNSTYVWGFKQKN